MRGCSFGGLEENKPLSQLRIFGIRVLLPLEFWFWGKDFLRWKIYALRNVFSFCFQTRMRMQLICQVSLFFLVVSVGRCLDSVSSVESSSCCGWGIWWAMGNTREPEEENVVEVSDLEFAYPGQKPFISKFSLKLKPGARCLLIGANGAG